MLNMSKMLPESTRSKLIQPFHVMRILARARELEQAGRDIVHMEVGEPDFATPQPIIDAGTKAIASGQMHYTAATGLLQLRKKIAQHYLHTYHCQVDPLSIVLTPGASGALLLALASVVEPGKNILMADPGYPCNRNFTRFLSGEVKSIPVDASTEYQLNAQLITDHWDEQTVGVILASPSNPTGTLIQTDTLQSIIDVVEQRRGVLFMDEIYHGLVYEQPAQSVLALTDKAFVINSFSKFYGMTGWRLGWLVVPQQYRTAVDNFAQNIFLAAPTPAQHAALAAFSNETTEILLARRDEFQQRRDYLLPAIQKLGFDIKVKPQGAFYLYADCSKFTNDSMVFVESLLEEAGVAITPGYDFGDYRAAQHVRFAYTTSVERLEEGMRRIGEFIHRV